METQQEEFGEPGGAAAGEAGTQPQEPVSEGERETEGRATRFMDRARGAVEGGKNRMADRLWRVGEDIDERAGRLEGEAGMKRHAAQSLHRAGGAIERGADYLRTHDIGAIRDDTKARIREHPFMSVGLALGTGFVIGRVFGFRQEREDEQLKRRLRMQAVERVARRRMMRSFGQAVLGGLSMLLARRIRERAAGFDPAL